MADRLPTLTSLRAFEAAARHMSFALAAAELNVTPAALSQQIKSLEEQLGAPVFRRLNRAVELTEAGRALQPGVRDGFQAIGSGWRAANRLSDHRSLTITAGPAFTSKWLAPRMFEFAQAHPEIELRFSATLRLLDFDRDEVDVAIRFGGGEDDGFYSRTILREWMTPMMTPALAETYPTPESLLKAPLLHQNDFAFAPSTNNWQLWFNAMGLGTPSGQATQFSQADHTHDAAVNGMGVMMGRSSISERGLREGRIVAPFDVAISLPYRYRFICQLGAEVRPQVQAFEAWLMAEIAKMQDFSVGKTIVPLADIPV